MSMIVCCSSQVLPDHFEDIAHAKAFCDVEKAARSKGSMLQGVALDVPLAVLSQQRLHVVKYYVTGPKAADPEAANGADSEGETMGGATSGESESDNDVHDHRDY